MSVLETLLTDLPADCAVTDVYVGANWILSLVNTPKEIQRAGVASTPKHIPSDSRFQIGHYPMSEKADSLAQFLLSADATTAAVGLATLNALHQPPESALTTEDAADWLSAQCAHRSIAIFGRFPFIEDEIRPFARQVWVFEQDPQAGEFDMRDAATVLPQAELVAITSSSVINHTINDILPHVKTGTTVALLGPSTPLSAKLFECGIHAMFGVRVVDTNLVIQSVLAGEGFQKMQGLQRVSLFK